MRIRGSGFDYKRTIAIGLLFAIGSLYKQLFVVTAFFLACIHIAIPPDGANNRWNAAKQILAISCMGIVTWAGVFAYFALTGRFQDFLDAVFTYNREYAGNVFMNIVRSFSPNLLFPYILKPIFPLLVLSALGTILGILKGHRRLWMLFIALALATQINIALPGRFYPHYYQFWLPLAVVGGGWSIAIFNKFITKRFRNLPHLIGIILLISLISYELPLYRLSANIWSQTKYGYQFVLTNNMAHELNRMLKPDETFYEWGNEPGLYFITKRRPLSGVFYAYPLFSKSLGSSLAKRLITDLNKKPPDLIIISIGMPLLPIEGEEKPHPNWLLSEYRPLPGNPYHHIFTLYARRGSELEKRIELAESKKRLQ